MKDEGLIVRDILNGKIEAILTPVLANRCDNICIIDPPGHPNVGDSAILLGELAFLRRKFPAARIGFYDVRSYSEQADAFIDSASLILIHGGGNFGDLWPHHHGLRVRILDRFSHKTIVQLPQSIHFDDPEQLRRTAAVLQKQTDFTLCVRDLESLNVAETHFDCRTILMPDMAFAMEPIVRKAPIVDCFCLLRTDKERTADHEAIVEALRAAHSTFEATDWLTGSDTFIASVDSRLGSLTKRRPAITAPFRSVMMGLREKQAMQRLEFGIKLLSRGTNVVADRLHAHIMCCLLDIPHFVFDSRGGKISAFHKTWTEHDAKTQFVQSPSAFAAMWREHASTMA